MQFTNINQVMADRFHHNCSLFDHTVLIIYGFAHLLNQSPVIYTHFQHGIIMCNFINQLIGLKGIQRGAQSFYHRSGRRIPEAFRTLVIGGLSRELKRLYLIVRRIIFVILILWAWKNYFPSLNISPPFTVKVLGLPNIRLFYLSRGKWRFHFYIINRIILYIVY